MRAMYFAEELGAHIYFPHISSRMALDEMRRWRQRFQVCPRDLPALSYAHEESELGRMGKANPPFRARTTAKRCGKRSPTVRSTWSPPITCRARRATKEKPLWLASQGFPATATILPVLLSEGYHKRRCRCSASASCSRPVPAESSTSRRSRAPRSGSRRRPHARRPEQSACCTPPSFGSYSDYSLYDGWKFKGWPVRSSCAARR